MCIYTYIKTIFSRHVLLLILPYTNYVYIYMYIYTQLLLHIIICMEGRRESPW